MTNTETTTTTYPAGTVRRLFGAEAVAWLRANPLGVNTRGGSRNHRIRLEVIEGWGIEVVTSSFGGGCEYVRRIVCPCTECDRWDGLKINQAMYRYEHRHRRHNWAGPDFFRPLAAARGGELVGDDATPEGVLRG